MVTVDQVKAYLHIPYNDENTLIQNFIDDGYNYLRDAIDDFDDAMAASERFEQKANMWVLTRHAPRLHDNREGTQPHEVDPLLLQLQLLAEEVLADD